MAWRLGTSVVEGEIDNRERGHVRGKIWLHGRNDPIELDLNGDCLRDIAGTLVFFRNPNPEPEDALDLEGLQVGVVGDMTASRKVRIIEVSIEEARQLRKSGKTVPEHVANGLYLEWYSEVNGRVVVESTQFEIRISEGTWRMTANEERGQLRRNMDAIEDWMDQLREADEYWDEEFYEEDALADEGPADEFEWERRLKESDTLRDRYSALIEKYAKHPDRDRIVAREMGWAWLDDTFEGDRRGDRPPADGDAREPLSLPEPNPLTEGTDWVRTQTGRITHPLSFRAYDLAQSIRRFGEEHRLLGQHGDRELREMVFQVQCLSAKLAGALNGLAYDCFVEPGFIVASLKRTFTCINQSVAAADAVAEKDDVPDVEKLKTFRSALFEIRQEILRLMKHYRRQR